MGAYSNLSVHQHEEYALVRFEKHTLMKSDNPWFRKCKSKYVNNTACLTQRGMGLPNCMLHFVCFFLVQGGSFLIMTNNRIEKDHRFTKSTATTFCQKQYNESLKKIRAYLNATIILVKIFWNFKIFYYRSYSSQVNLRT